MRLSLFFLMLILLPVAAGVHTWLFAKHELPGLVAEAKARLLAAGVRDPVVTLHCLDIDLAGEAADPPAHERALDAIRQIGVLRLKPQADRIHVFASVRHELGEKTLRVSGWLPEPKDVAALSALLADLRPDLQIDTSELRHAPEVRWPEDYQPPLDATDAFLAPILDSLHVPAELKIEATEDMIVLSGMLPAGGIKEALVAAISGAGAAHVVDPGGLKASPHVRPASFAKKEPLAAFAASFFAAPAPRLFEMHDQHSPRITGVATRRLESEWLALLRPVTGGAVVDSRLTLLPSEYHFPGYKTQTQLPAATLAQLRGLLRESTVVFESGTRIPAAEQSRLSALAPALLNAGPALALVIAGHPDPAAADAEKETRLAKSRAEAVLSFLEEEGVPSSDITAIACDPVPPDSAAAPPRSVEILIK